MYDYDNLYQKVLRLFPNAQMGEDEDGQLIVYTDMMLDGNDDVVKYEERNKSNE